MWKQSLSLLEFIGGPFDGFSQRVTSEPNEFPKCVALPLNRESARLLGFKSRPAESDRIAIYRLKSGDKSLRYQFHSMHVAETVLPGERGGAAP